jgi:hypothetical protein
MWTKCLTYVGYSISISCSLCTVKEHMSSQVLVLSPYAFRYFFMHFTIWIFRMWMQKPIHRNLNSSNAEMQKQSKSIEDGWCYYQTFEKLSSALWRSPSSLSPLVKPLTEEKNFMQECRIRSNVVGTQRKGFSFHATQDAVRIHK